MEEKTKTVIDKLKEHASTTPSKWREEAEYRRANRTWLRYSQHIALLMLNKMDALGINRKQLAEKMNCSPQYISKVLKGQENLSLETLSKIEATLGISIFKEEPTTVCHLSD